MYCILCLEVAKSLCKILINYNQQKELMLLHINVSYVTTLSLGKAKNCVENLLILNLIEYFTNQSKSD
jgi:hypothetical protein